MCVCVRAFLRRRTPLTTVDAPVALLAAPQEYHNSLAVEVVLSERISQQTFFFLAIAVAPVFRQRPVDYASTT